MSWKAGVMHEHQQRYNSKKRRLESKKGHKFYAFMQIRISSPDDEVSFELHLLRKESECLLTHHETVLLCGFKVLTGNVCVTGVWCVILAISCKALGDTNT